MSDFSYDDQECPSRGPGLKHIRKSTFDIDCQYCDQTIFSSNQRWLFGTPERPAEHPKPSKDRCMFWTCDTTVTIRAFLEVWQSLPDGDSYLADREAYWFCMQHEATVKSSKKRLLKVRRSVEGWIWVDNIDHIRFAA